jgi:hypothetical protein
MHPHCFLVLVCVGILSLADAIPAYSQQCGEILKYGIWSHETGSSTESEARSFSNWLCTNQFSSFQQMHDAGFSIG